MPEKIITTDPPKIDEEDFEDYLATDDLFVDYFNTFLGLPSFPEPLRFNSESGGFEVLSSEKHEIAEKIKAAARVQTRTTPQTAQSIFYGLDDEHEEEEIKTSFSVMCLDKEQGIQWIKEERLPSFLQSELYMEYRLAKLLSQVETSPGGMKLTIDPNYRPWYKAREPPPPPVPVDETEIMIQKMYVTLGATPLSQMKDWYSMAKQTETDSLTISPSRPLSSATVTTGAWARPNSSSRPTSVQSTRIDIAEDSSRYLDSGMWTGALTETSRYSPYSRKSKSSMMYELDSLTDAAETITKKSGSTSIKKLDFSDFPEIIPPAPSVPIHSEDAACMLPESSNIRSVGTVARIEPVESDDESDQGMGSECESSLDESDHMTGSTSRSRYRESSNYGLELRTLEDYSSVFVALGIKNAMMYIDKDITAETLDSMTVFEDLIPKPKEWLIGLRGAMAPVPISKLDEKVFAEALLAQERRVLEETGSLSRKSAKSLRSSKVETLSSGQSGRDILDLLDLPKKKITFDDTIAGDSEYNSKMLSTNCSEIDEHDSIFSEQSDIIDSRYVTKSQRYDLIDVKGFSKFKEFINDTMGGVIAQLWMDIDKSRFSHLKNKGASFLSKLRQKYLNVGSVHRVSRELLKKWGIEHASEWTLKNLQNLQRSIVEPLLLYWAPRFLIHQLASTQKIINIQNGGKLLNRRLPVYDTRPMSSQSYPTPKTVIIRPLRPKSCLPRIKVGQESQKEEKSAEKLPEVPKDSPYHVMGMYQQKTYHPKYQHPMYHTQKFKSNMDQIKMPKSLFPDTKEPLAKQRPNSKYLAQLRSKAKRPVSASQLTMGTLAIFESKARIKSAREGSHSYPWTTAKRSGHVFKVDSRSVTSVHTVSSTSSRSTIRGSEPMESMLQALYYDTRAGWVFTRFCEQSKNVLWNNAVHFWFDVQDYHNQFYTSLCNNFTIQRKAQVIYSTYIVLGAAEDIEVSTGIRMKIQNDLAPAFDELFDNAEEYVLKLLIVPWNKMLGDDQASYRKVELIEQERNLQVASKYLSFLQKKGVIKGKSRNAESEMQAEDKYEVDLWEKVHDDFRNFTFDDLVRNRLELEHFRKFLEDNYAKTDLICWLDIESFKRIPHQAIEKQDEKAIDIKNKYLHKKYFFGPSSPASKEQQLKVVQAAGGWGKTLKERPPNELIVGAQRYVRNRLMNKWLPRFLATDAFLDRQRPKSQMSDVAEDVVLQRKKKKGEPWKLLDNRWQTSTREVVEFRHALSNPVTSTQFQRYVAVKGDLLENDLLFWLEVQKYKDFCHAHNEQAAIDAKILAIIHCFLDSQIPPALQIDIPTEMAERIIEKRRDLGPYVFREAQLTVFRVLFPLWSGFCEFRKNLTDEKLTTTLERQRQRKMERIRKQLIQQHNEQIAREEAEAEKEREAEAAGNLDSLADILSSNGSDAGDSIATAGKSSRKHQVKWSYGKYIEGLDRERHLLLMENELEGRIPLEELPEIDEDVSSKDSDSVISDSSSGIMSGSRATSDVTGSVTGKHKKKRKKTKDKVIFSTIPERPKNSARESVDQSVDVAKKAGTADTETTNGERGTAKTNGKKDSSILKSGKGGKENKKHVVVID